jgi:hypothetical protein
MQITQTHGTQIENIVGVTIEDDNDSHERAVEQGLISTGKTQTTKDVLQSRISISFASLVQVDFYNET